MATWTTDYSQILSTEQSFREFKWYNSYSLPQEINCNVKRLELPYNIEIENPSEIFIVANIICNNFIMTLLIFSMIILNIIL